jgi:hypothetical protein
VGGTGLVLFGQAVGRSNESGACIFCHSMGERQCSSLANGIEVEYDIDEEVASYKRKWTTRHDATSKPRAFRSRSGFTLCPTQSS